MDISKIRPTGDQVLLAFDIHSNEERVSPGGIVIPQTAAPPSNIYATVVACGSGYYNDKWPGGEQPNWHETGSSPIANGAFIPVDEAIVPGARVVCAREALAGDRVYGDNRHEYRMVRAHVIIAVVENA